MVSITKYINSTAAITTLMSFAACTPALSFSFELPSGFNQTLAEQYQTSLYFYSQPGDWVGRGREWFYSPNDGKFGVSRNFDNGISFNFDNFGIVDWGKSTWWHADFAAPFEKALSPGSYNGATRFPFQNMNNPGLSFSGDGRGCNRLGGRFDILEAQYETDGKVSNFDAVFAQYCENPLATGTPALFGRVRYNASNKPVDNPTSVPEPASWIGLVGASFFALRKRLKSV